MRIVKSQPFQQTPIGYKPCAPGEATHLMFKLPGKISTHILPVILSGTREGTGAWTWNGSVDKPTLKPSILSKHGDNEVVHIWLNDGMCQFLGDSTQFAGETLPLVEFDYEIEGP